RNGRTKPSRVESIGRRLSGTPRNWACRWTSTLRACSKRCKTMRTYWELEGIQHGYHTNPNGIRTVGLGWPERLHSAVDNCAPGTLHQCNVADPAVRYADERVGDR